MAFSSLELVTKETLKSKTEGRNAANTVKA